MKATILTLMSFFVLAYSFGQNDPKKGMTYDKENAMYYHISKDEQYLYLNFYKDEYVQKITTLGGIKIFFNLEGKRDTVGMPKIVYPVYQYPKKEYEEIEIMGFNGVPEGKMSVYNEYGFIGESKVTEVAGKGIYAKDRAIFEGRIAVPLNSLKNNGNKKLFLKILLRGKRIVPVPAGANMGVMMNSNPEQDAFRSQVNNWTWSWVEYELK